MMPVRRNQNWLPSIFNDFFGNEWVDKSNVTAPAVNILETEDDFKVEVAAPGMSKEDFNIKLDEDNNLVISMEKKSEITEDDRKDYEKELQDITEKRCKQIDELTAKKEAELMAV